MVSCIKKRLNKEFDKMVCPQEFMEDDLVLKRYFLFKRIHMGDKPLN